MALGSIGNVDKSERPMSFAEALKATYQEKEAELDITEKGSEVQTKEGNDLSDFLTRADEKPEIGDHLQVMEKDDMQPSTDDFELG